MIANLGNLEQNISPLFYKPLDFRSVSIIIIFVAVFIARNSNITASTCRFVQVKANHDASTHTPLLEKLFYYAVHIFVTELIGNLPHDIQKEAKQKK